MQPIILLCLNGMECIETLIKWYGMQRNIDALVFEQNKREF